MLQAQPTINSFAPASGAVGTTVTITGTNFNTTPSSNIVFFGAVKASVSSATATSLTVVVPVGATFQPISVTTGGLKGYSAQPFVVTFAGGGFIDENSFATNIDSSTGLVPYHITSADLDGDGNPDLLTANKDDNSVSVLRNTTVNGSISFASRMDLACTQSPYQVLTTDLDNDGKQDIAVTTFNGFSVFRNTSTVGSLSFASRQDYTTDYMGFIRAITSADFDGDGKTDIVIADHPFSGVPTPYGFISIYRNTSAVNAISFAPKVNLDNVYSFTTMVFCLQAVDLDNDGKRDLAITFNSPDFLVMRNESSPGVLSFGFDYTDTLPHNSSPRGLAIGDMNGDNKPDLVIADHFTDSISIFKNVSIPGDISFYTRMDFIAGGSPRTVTINDIDGDGRLDVAASNVYFTGPPRPPLVVFKNNSSGGNISLSPYVYFSSTYQPWSIALVDFNRDGKADIATANSGGSATASVLKNRVGEIFSLCAGGNATISSGISGANYQWQVSTDSITFTNLSDNVNYSGTNTPTLQLNNIPSSWYGLQYRCVVDGNYSTVSTIQFTNHWTGAINNQWEIAGNWSCGSVPDINTDVVINGGTIILNSNTIIRSLHLSPTANFIVSPGVILTITH